MRSRWLVIGGTVGAVLGAALASVGATRVFAICDDNSFEAACASPDVLLALLWGVSIGLVVGVLTGAVISRRESAR